MASVDDNIWKIKNGPSRRSQQFCVAVYTKPGIKPAVYLYTTFDEKNVTELLNRELFSHIPVYSRVMVEGDDRYGYVWLETDKQSLRFYTCCNDSYQLLKAWALNLNDQNNPKHKVVYVQDDSSDESSIEI